VLPLLPFAASAAIKPYLHEYRHRAAAQAQPLPRRRQPPAKEYCAWGRKAPVLLFQYVSCLKHSPICFVSIRFAVVFLIFNSL
jgi:hypothetical protein